MPALLFELITIAADFLIFVFIGYYLLRIRKIERNLQKKEVKVDTDYHQIVDNALSKERRILDDATVEANQIISGGKYITDQTKQAVDVALQKMITDVHKETVDTTRIFMQSYQHALKQLALDSLTEFQTISKNLQTDLQKQVDEFHKTLLPKMEKELDEYKANRMKQAEQQIAKMLQTVSQEVLNKSISLEDHENLVVSSFEKAKKEGMFN